MTLVKKMVYWVTI